MHDKDNEYSWNTLNGGTTPNGTVFTAFLGTLNNGTSPDGVVTTGCFAGHCDWRLPAIEELQTILLAPFPCGTNPCIDQTVFGPTLATVQWSATTDAANASQAWRVNFANGGAGAAGKVNGAFHVRAVRSGL